MVNPLSSNYYDYFTSFDFLIQKGLPLALSSMLDSENVASAVPEPSTACMFLLALACFGCNQRRRS
jgi:hypothetical protein